MKILKIAALLIFAAIGTSHANPASEEKKAVTAVAEQFYAQYNEHIENTDDLIQKSKLLTPEFKKAYAKAMKSEELDADPVLEAQDNLPSPAKAKAVTVKGETATVTLKLSKTSESGGGWSSVVYLVKRDGVWLIHGTNQILGK